MSGASKRVRVRRRALVEYALALLSCGPADDVVAIVSEAKTCLHHCGSTACPCPGKTPIAMRLPDGAAFAIDATEVTVESYWKFLHTGTTPAVGPVAHESVCGWNTSFAPKEDAAELDPNCSQHFDFERLVDEEPNRPVVCVDWCDAAAYCSWIGGHLCGLAGGAVMTRDQFGVEDEWYSACSSQGTTAYSYGDEFDAQACNTLNAGHGSVAIAVASLPSCEGPSRGLFDMNGNADEWVAACDSFESEGASLVSCYRVGGAFFQGGVEQSRCDSAYSGYRGLQGNDTGFRCCYD